jgi:hypothetical protein
MYFGNHFKEPAASVFRVYNLFYPEKGSSRFF